MLSIKTIHNHTHTIVNVSTAERNKLIDAESAVLIWEQLLKKGLAQSEDKLKEAREKYQALCLEYKI